MKKGILIIAIFVLLVFTYTAGRVEDEIVDEINVATAIGFDKIEENKIKGTCVIPVFLADKSIENEHFTEESTLAKEIINVLQKKSADPLVTGGLKVALYSEDLAKDGLITFIDSLQRDASLASKMYLAVVDGNPSEILEKNLGNRGTGVYLSTLLEHNSTRRDLPKANLQTFLFRYYSDGMDAFLPFVKLVGNKVEIRGLSIFKEGKMVDYVKEEDLFFFKALVENFGTGSFTLNLEEEDEHASVKRISSERIITVEEVDGKPEVNIEISFEGILSEFSGRRTDEKIIKEIVNKLESLIVSRSEKLIRQFLEKGVDPIGIGFMAKTSLRNFNESKWKDEYKNLKFNVTSDVKLTETGIIE